MEAAVEELRSGHSVPDRAWPDPVVPREKLEVEDDVMPDDQAALERVPDRPRATPPLLQRLVTLVSRQRSSLWLAYPP
jgi:hypothetical protein